MSKENGMEKLVELLREYNMSNQSPYILGDADYYVDDVLYAPQIISKSYGFIEWLVENEKIEFREDFYLEDQHGGGFGEDENIIMLLAIQDEPIKFLTSILK